MKSTKLIFLAAALLAAASAARAANYEFRPITIANGGGTSAGGVYTFKHTIGQPALGTVRGGNYSVALGHWNQVAATPPLPLPDLTVSSSLSPIVVTENIVRDVTLAVTNRGAGAATGVRFGITLPPGLPVTAATNSAGACTITSSNVTCTVASLASGGAFTVQLSLRATPLPESSAEFVNLADLSAVLTANEPDANPTNNTMVLPVTAFVRLDWGDAPGGFPVTRAENGARQRFWPGYRLGALWDSEGTGVHSLLADWDDGQQVDDEDGVTFVTPLFPGAQVTVIVNSSFNGFIRVWADFNNDSDWADAGEEIFADHPLVVGNNTLTFTVPPTAVIGSIITRWRASTTGGLSYTGYGDKGEIEDHLVQVQAPPYHPVNFGGLLHAPLGGAVLNVNSNGLQLSNLGSSGQDGVSIALGQAAGWQGRMQFDFDPMAGQKRVQWEMRGILNNASNQLFGTGRYELQGTQLVAYADSSPLGATGYRVDVYSNATVLASFTVQPGEPLYSLRPTGALPRGLPQFTYKWIEPPEISDIPPCSFWWPEPCEVTLGGTHYPTADHVGVTPLGVTATMGAMTSVAFTGVGVQQFVLSDEALFKHDWFVSPLLDSTLEARDNGLVVTTASGTGGVNIATTSLHDDTASDGDGLLVQLAPIDLTVSNAQFRVEATGRSADGSVVSLGSVSLASTTGGDVQLTSTAGAADSSEVRVDVYNSGELVGGTTLAHGVLGRFQGTGRLITAGRVAGPDGLWIGLSEANLFQPASGPTLTGDAVRVTPMASGAPAGGPAPLAAPMISLAASWSGLGSFGFVTILGMPWSTVSIKPVSVDDFGTTTPQNVGQHVKYQASVLGGTVLGHRWTVSGDILKDYFEETTAAWSTTAMEDSDYRNPSIEFYWKPDSSQIHPNNDGPVSRTIRLLVTSGFSSGRGPRLTSLSVEVERNTDDIDRQPVDFFTKNHDGVVDADHTQWHRDHSPSDSDYGELFFSFHHEFIDRWDQWRSEFGYGPDTTWDPGTPIPADPEIDDIGRNTYDATDQADNAIPTYFTVAGGTDARTSPGTGCDTAGGQTKLADFADRCTLGTAVGGGPWHGSVHVDVGGIAGPLTPTDGLFFRWHRYVDGIDTAWSGLPIAPPSITWSSPFPFYRYLTSFPGELIVRFNKPVSGVTADVLTVDGSEATRVEALSPTSYKFSGFAVPSLGGMAGEGGAAAAAHQHHGSHPIIVMVGAGTILGTNGLPFAGAFWVQQLLAPNEDSDGDGLTNAEEIRRRTNPFHEDTDHDGISDGAEVAAGTNPLVGRPGPLRTARVSPGAIEIRWEAFHGGRLQSAPAVTGPWTDTGLRPQLDGADLVIRIPPGGGMKFYRLAR